MRLETKSRFEAKRNVLVVDDEAGMRMALELSFGQRGWQVEAAAGKADAVCRFRQRAQPLVVSDVRMPDGDGFELLHEIQAVAPETAVILLTAFGAVPDAVSAMKFGACEYLTKPIAFEQLLDLSERIVSCKARDTSCDTDKLIGGAPGLLQAIKQANQAAVSDADVLIEAESGTGKELLARMIHARSSRREQPFVAINCAALPESLLESELFGHGRGAFTGATAPQSGKFELANGGTLLLDEIGEMPLALQPKLLRVLQEREFYRLGESNPVRVDVRVIATTNRTLAEMVQQGSFRGDLFYRLNVIPLTLPPLRERAEDIRELALYFARMFAADPSITLPESLLIQLEQHSWPGNVRELANFVRRVMAFGPEPISDLDLFRSSATSLSSNIRHSICEPAERGPNALVQFAAGISLETAEKRLLEITLAATGGNRSRTAEMLGISLRTVRNKIREYNLPPRREYARLVY